MKPSATKRSRVHQYESVDMDDSDAFKMIGLSSNLVEDHGCKLEPPVVVCMGDQNVGKSHFLGRVTEQKLCISRGPGDNQNAPKTLCPVYHNYRFSEEQTYTITGDIRGVSNEELVAEKILNQTGVSMELLSRTAKNILTSADGFISTHGGLRPDVYINLKVMGPGLKNMHFVDLPGMSYNDVNYNNYLTAAIGTFTKKYLNAIYVFVTTATNLTGCSLWNQINTMRDKSNVVWVITRPDGLDLNDSRLKQIIADDGVKYSIPKSNIFIVKNHDTTSKTIPTDEDESERTYFEEHPVYGPMVRDVQYKSHFGVKNVRDFIYGRLKACLKLQLPSIESVLRKQYEQCEKEQRTINVTPMETDQNSRRVNSDRVFMKFLSYMKSMFSGVSGFTNDTVLSIRTCVSIDFRRDIQSIPYNVGMDDRGILLECARAGGVVESIGGFTRETFLNLMFDRPDSPYNAMLMVIESYVNRLDFVFRKLISEIVLPEMTYISEDFWNRFHEHVENTITKQNLSAAIESFCVIQKHNYRNYLQDPSSHTDLVDPDRKQTPVTILSNFWKDVKDNVCRNFPKYVAEFLIDRNIRALEESCAKTHVKLAKYLVEKSDITEKRASLSDKMRTIEDVLKTLKELRHRVK